MQAHGSRRLMTDILKGELGFKGFLISDWAAIDAIPGDYKSDVETSINAGLDMVMVPDKYPEFYNTLKSLVEEGAVPMARIDDAVRRILRVKAGMGLLDEGANVMADRRLHASFGSAGASRGRPRGGPPVAGAPEERGQGAAAREGRPASTSPGATPTTSGTSAADGPSSGRARAVPSPPAEPRSCRRSAGPCPRRRR